MSNIRIKMAKDLRDMSDMVGDLHWMAAKAVEDLTKKDGEIAKRDEELAACRVAVENCDLFRARIAEIEADRDSHQRCAIQAMAELAALKAQGVVMPERWNVPRPMWKDARQPYGNPLNHADIEAAEKFNLALDEVVRLNAAPAAPAADAVSERLDNVWLGGSADRSTEVQ